LIPISIDEWTVQSIISLPVCSSKTNVWLSRDVSTAANTGAMILTNSRWTRKFLQQWIAIRKQPGILNEQLGLDFWLSSSNHTDVDKARVCVLDEHLLNSILPAMTTLDAHHPFLHLAAEDNLFRAGVFRLATETVCDAFTRHVRIPAQLGFNQLKLLQIAFES
jgi:hypothetical protein